MDDYLITFREMISLRGLTDHISDRAMNAGISQLRFFTIYYLPTACFRAFAS